MVIPDQKKFWRVTFDNFWHASYERATCMLVGILMIAYVFGNK
jgi:hypothetical protein